jgi:hypothetical protein
MARKLQFRKVSGKGLIQDEELQAFEGLSPEEEKEVREAFQCEVYCGSILDYVNPDQVERLANIDASAITEADMASFQTSWNGVPLPKGTRYCVIVGDEKEELSGAGAFLTKQFADAFAKERFVQAEGNKAFQGGASAEARKNIGQSAKTPGGVWGQKRQGPPRF